MSKRGLPDDLMDQTMGTTASTGDTVVHGSTSEDPMELVQIRLPRSMKADLQRLFRARGLSMAAGCRSILADYRNASR